MAEQQSSGQSWTWPERSTDGNPSQGSSGAGSAAETSGEPSRPPSRLEPQFVESARSAAIRSSAVAVVSTLLSAAATFGFELTPTQSAAMISAIGAIGVFVAVILAGRRG